MVSWHRKYYENHREGVVSIRSWFLFTPILFVLFPSIFLSCDFLCACFSFSLYFTLSLYLSVSFCLTLSVRYSLSLSLFLSLIFKNKIIITWIRSSWTESRLPNKFCRFFWIDFADFFLTDKFIKFTLTGYD